MDNKHCFRRRRMRLQASATYHSKYHASSTSSTSYHHSCWRYSWDAKSILCEASRALGSCGTALGRYLMHLRMSSKANALVRVTRSHIMTTRHLVGEREISWFLHCVGFLLDCAIPTAIYSMIEWRVDLWHSSILWRGWLVAGRLRPGASSIRVRFASISLANHLLHLIVCLAGEIGFPMIETAVGPSTG
jgi:hypothetical protein